jgi:hypothetical protein
MFALRGQPAPALPNYCRAQATHANAVFHTVGSEKTNNSSRKSVHNRGLRPEACKLAELELQPIEWHPLSDHAVWNALAIYMRAGSVLPEACLEKFVGRSARENERQG